MAEVKLKTKAKTPRGTRRFAYEKVSGARPGASC
jgi:hypothetical protein